MKKLLFMAAALLLCVGMQAQIVSSRSSIVRHESTPSNTQWYLRAGLGVMNLAGTEADANIGYNATFGFQKGLGGAGAYWGMEFGLGSRGCKVEDLKYIAHNVQYSPFTFGWKFNLVDDIAIDPHIGVFASYDYTSKIKANGESASWGDFAESMGVDYNHFDVGMGIGVGIWYSRFNLDFAYQRGFVNAYSDVDKMQTSNFLIRLGVAF